MNAAPEPHLSPAALRAYALDELSAAQFGLVDAHVETCLVCRAQVKTLHAELARLVEALPSAGVLPPLRRPLPAPLPERRQARPAFRPALLGGLVLVLGALGLGWGWSLQTELATLRAEQAQVTRWLSQPQVSILALKDTHRQPAGQVLLLPTREVLFVLPRPAKGKLYQVWVAANWKRGDPLTPQGVSTGGTFSAPVGDNDYVCVSLENRPAAPGQTRPTQILGWTKL